MKTSQKTIKNLLILGILGGLLLSCGQVRYVPVETVKEIHIRDSVWLRPDTVKVDVPFEVYRDVVPEMDTLVLETSVARAVAWADTSTRALKGSIENKHASLVKPIEIPERIQYRDSLVYKEVPVPVVKEKVVKVVPWFWRFFGAIGVLAVAGAVAWILRRFKIL